MIKINISFHSFCAQRLIVSSIIRKCIRQTLKAEGVDFPCEINVLITNDEGIRNINKISRNIDKPTDVLSFPMFQLDPDVSPNWEEMTDPETGMCPLGDMAISLERAYVQAKQFGHSVRREIGYLTIHSVLHLLGYDHLDEGPQKAKMRKREESIASTISGMHR